MKIFLASFNRASEGAIEYLRKELKAKDMITYDPQKATHIMAVGDRKETYDFVLKYYRKNVPIIHLWAGEISQGTHDEVYRHSMTLMSMLQLCTNNESKTCVEDLCLAVQKKSNAHIVGNVMLDDLTVDDEAVPFGQYNLVLYNPVTLYTEDEVKEEIKEIREKLKELKEKEKIRNVVWIEPNGDDYSHLLHNYVTHKNLPRSKFLGLMQQCEYFITNSSCQFYEAQFLIKKQQIISIGERNQKRNSKTANMSLGNATENIIHILEELESKTST